jgi:hypothetical protein
MRSIIKNEYNHSFNLFEIEKLNKYQQIKQYVENSNYNNRQIYEKKALQSEFSFGIIKIEIFIEL